MTLPRSDEAAVGSPMSASTTTEATTRTGAYPRHVAWGAVARCLVRSLALLGRRRVDRPRGNVGRVVRFADGTAGRVYRETVVADRVAADPCVLIVCFRLRFVHGVGHTWFRAESILNTPLFVGFPGFVSKLWLDHDARGLYRGLYEWDCPGLAEYYARSLWRVLLLVSEPDSIDFRVLPGLRRDTVLDDPRLPSVDAPLEEQAWWRIVPRPRE